MVDVKPNARLKHYLKTFALEPRGFSLVEVMVALTILSVGMLAAASLMSNSLRSDRGAHGITEAVTVAEDLAEQLLSAPLTDTRLSSETASNPHTARATLDDRYRLRWTVTDAFPTPQSVHIRIVVQWRENGRDHYVPLNYVRTKT